MTNDNQDAITFDPNSGISEDEQKEILAKINGITESRRRSLSATAVAAEAGTAAGKGKKIRFAAKKSGNLFPVLVNSAAVVALVAGLFVLSSFQGKTDFQARTGTKVYNSAERALIEEIRKETSSRLKAKENELSMITTQLEGIDAELKGLYSNNGDLTDEQRVTETRLKSLHDEYSASLAKLQDERSVILEEARVQEAVLQSRLENRTREFAFTEGQNIAAPEPIRDEMDRMAKEQAQTATVETQMGAFFANLNEQIRENRLDDAVGTIRSMRNFLNTPAFLVLRSIQARRELYMQSINALEAMVDEARRSRAAPAGDVRQPDDSALAELKARNTELEQILAAFSTQGSDTSGLLAEREKTITDLRNNNRTLQSNLATQTRDTQTARQETAAARTEIANRDSLINDLRKTITDLNNEIARLGRSGVSTTF
jgi:chromosome segregation ATPase